MHLVQGGGCNVTFSCSWGQEKPRNHVTCSCGTCMMETHLFPCTDLPCSTKFGFLARASWTGLGMSPPRARTAPPLRYQWVVDICGQNFSSVCPHVLEITQEQLALGISHTNQSLLSLVPSTEKELSHSVGGQGWPGSGSIFWLYLGIHVCLGRGLLSQII